MTSRCLADHEAAGRTFSFHLHLLLLLLSSGLANVKYDIAVYTGNESGSGTNANVFITIYGTTGDSGKRPLTQKFRDLFERNQTDNFQIEAVDLGK
jgi:hypothetical protein